MAVSRERRLLRKSFRKCSLSLFVLVTIIVLNVYLSSQNFLVEAADDDYYSDDAVLDDAVNDDAVVADDAVVDDDDAAVVGDDDDNNAAVDDDNGDYGDDDLVPISNGLSIMPVSCINYNNGHMIKYDFFESNDNGNSQCHFNHAGSLVVSIAHFMRAYFNQEALLKGKDFTLPSDAGYLNCVMLQETKNYEKQLYAKIGCMDRETFTSTKLQLHVYEDAQCSVPYDDGATSKRHSSRGYEINGYYFSSRVSFKPPFYTCLSCTPDQISETFNKQHGNWYDDDYISQYGAKQNGDDYVDDTYQADDGSVYMYANDDVGRDDDARYNFANNDDVLNRLLGENEQTQLNAVPGDFEKFFTDFWNDVDTQRSLYGNYYDVGDWNMCQQIKKYGVWCDSECQALDAYRVNEWSTSDTSLLVLMCVFVAAMMLLVVAKRLKVSQKARVYGDDNYKPGLPPLAMAMIFLLIMAIITTLALFKFVNETLVFAVVTCVLLFIYMLKLTLFESRRPVLLAAPRHDVFDNPLDDHFFS
mmetsp:Transcript_20127/g.30267  ORF Transcript_20127/g.30267 Transcript_20127/m.30267 type:complete len:528 (-) Transcript_20127:422-2005(-)|eukprot:CAMPEP_0178902248 /NCGR_PEP_ID=MMETSP0786-20121207/4497_1 /TAXON_ID=186022 /ORGANISM="Thalassionema frauenfeldii, Strain CCMP 1798" /LENGTH=527 /DNA_ID=CAMNT_0020573489 /DNA_START=77 /DNA_END=1660 /DNA_ORIENTATION=-